MTNRVAIYTDGACSGNPGPGGWAAILVYKTTEKELSGSTPETTNNRMELQGVIEGLKALTRHCNVDVYSDSQYVVRGATEWLAGWQRNNWRRADKKPVENQDLWQDLAEQLSRHKVNMHWVRGHDGHEYNERADTLAVEAVDKLVGRTSRPKV